MRKDKNKVKEKYSRIPKEGNEIKNKKTRWGHREEMHSFYRGRH